MVTGKSYLAVKHVYPGVVVSKLECDGHVQKHVGRGLYNLKNNNKGLGGKGRLTDAVIDQLQNYYGITIRQNVNDMLMV